MARALGVPELIILLIPVIYGAVIFGIIYFAVRLAIRHERQRSR